jgi:hypothetical protein
MRLSATRWSYRSAPRPTQHTEVLPKWADAAQLAQLQAQQVI